MKKKQKQTTLNFGKATTKRKRVLDEDEDEEEQIPKPKKTKKTKEPEEEQSDEEEIDFANISKKSTLNSKKTKKKEKDSSERWNFLTDIRDKNKKQPGEEDYDPSTLYIPSSTISSMTGFERQYWNIKKDHFDKIVFFKKGKFYELYENDAYIANKHFGLKVTQRVNMPMAGFPESSLIRWARQFNSLRYKIVITEQVETINEKDARRSTKEGKKEDNIVNREVDRIMSVGTIVDSEILSDDDAHLLLSIKEDQMTNQFGFTLVDCSTSRFMLGFLEDDETKTSFETLMNQVIPREVIIEKGNLSKLSHAIIKQINPLFTIRRPTDQFLEADSSREILVNYFDSKSIPNTITQMESNDLVMSSLGATINYLKELRVDETLLSMSNFSIYDSSESFSTMILDGQTLQNLEILKNNMDGSKKGTLLNLLDHCSTPMGKRLFRNWLCHPLRDVEKIKERQIAINDILEFSSQFDNVENLLREVGDLERSITRIHCMANQKTQAVYFDGEGDKKKIQLYLDSIAGLQKSVNIVNSLESYASKFQSKTLFDLCTIGGSFPNITSTVHHFNTLFDHAKALNEGYVYPNKGVHEGYDEAARKYRELEKKAEDYLKKIQKELKSTKIQFLTRTKDKVIDYQIIDIPVSVKNIPSYLQFKTSTKTVNRYTSPELVQITKELVTVKEQTESILKNIFKEILLQFDAHSKDFVKAINCISTLDCLVSLSKSSKSSNITCKPEFVISNEPFLEIKQMINPCIKLPPGDAVIPNDTVLGSDEVARCVLLTGPNMGGKSTLLRQVCLAVIMAQLGAFVPADSFRLSSVDRIFTRIGANDKIMAGQSTFMVELQETSNILKNATKNSLVILDELGRGTSTFDGYSIAYSVIRYLAEKISCRTLFSTHYFMLTEELSNHPFIDLYKMGCLVEKESNAVIFKHTYEKGVCDKSYGLNVARLAQIPKEIVNNACEVSENMENENLSKTEKVKNKSQLKNSQIELFKSIQNQIKKGVTKEELLNLQKQVLQTFTYY
eukprot:gene12159-5649_t